MAKGPLGRLNGTPPLEHRIHKHLEGSFPLCVIREAGRACSQCPLTDFDRSVHGGQCPTCGGLIVHLELDVMEKELSEMGILDFIEISEDIHLACALAVRKEEHRDIAFLNDG